MKLVIVESPKKCDTIARYLGNDFVVMASQGHVRDLSTRGKGGLGIDIPAGFEPDYIISPKKKEIVAKLASAAKKASEVYLATDPDREGEAISWHLAEVLRLPVETTTKSPNRRFSKLWKTPRPLTKIWFVPKKLGEWKTALSASAFLPSFNAA